MSERMPSIALTPEGTLEARRQMDFRLYERRGQLFESMGYITGYEFEQSDELAIARVDVREALFVPSWNAGEVDDKARVLIEELEPYTRSSPSKH